MRPRRGQPKSTFSALHNQRRPGDRQPPCSPLAEEFTEGCALAVGAVHADSLDGAVRNYNRRMSEPADITGLLKAWSRGDKEALEQLMPLVYAQLHAQARRYMRSERADATLQSTALVHEVYLRLTKAHDVNWSDRAHFFALSAQIMRRILVDAARARTASKRGGGAPRAGRSPANDPDRIPAAQSDTDLMLCALDDALDSLAQRDPQTSEGDRIALLCWTERRRNGGHASGLAANGDARLAAREGVARARAGG